MFPFIGGKQNKEKLVTPPFFILKPQRLSYRQRKQVFSVFIFQFVIKVLEVVLFKYFLYCAIDDKLQKKTSIYKTNDAKKKLILKCSNNDISMKNEDCYQCFWLCLTFFLKSFRFVTGRTTFFLSDSSPAWLDERDSVSWTSVDDWDEIILEGSFSECEDVLSSDDESGGEFSVWGVCDVDSD